MTRKLSESSWAKGVLSLSLLLAFLATWQLVAGAIMLAAFNGDYNRATPFTSLQFWTHYGSNAEVQRWLGMSSTFAFFAVAVPIALLLRKKKPSLHGDARFAKWSEVVRAGLTGEKGLIIGMLRGRYLLFGGPQHALLVAPTRSGKGVSVVIPNLLHWPESCVVLDVKKENWDITSGYRTMHGQSCYLFDPVSSNCKTHRYNPLAYISSDPNFRIDDAQKIANMLFPDQQGTDPIWTATPRSLFVGIVLYLIEVGTKPITIGQVLRETLVEGDGAEYFLKLIKERENEGKPLTGACLRGLQSYASIASDNTRSGVMTSFRSRLELWMNPIVDAATSVNDFDLRDLRKKRMSIYVGITPDNLERLSPLVNLFFQQLIDLNTRELPSQNKDLKFTCLLLMDEFTAIGKINVLSKGISFIAGYGLRMMPIIQSASQLTDVYGKEAALTFTTNHAVNIVFPPKASDLQATRDISEWLGYTTVKGKSESRGKALFSKRHKSENISDQRRALLLPQEAAALGQDTAIIILENTPPIKARKATYFKDPSFVARLGLVSATIRGGKKSVITKDQMDAAMYAGELASTVPSIDLVAHLNQVERGLQGRPDVPQGGNPIIPPMDFAIDFSDIPAPALGSRSIDALQAWADELTRRAGF
ncbi:type IV secretory system conjugative DNA transfer family protein [Acidovorax sp.]|uniref:type IV secretory system conjugative DNA transfer family protein n=1 Tax=Acidovorax sp. TaxID=1872122 RepID=UPI00391F8354